MLLQRLYIGLNDKDTHEQMISPDYVSRISGMLNQLVVLETIQDIRCNFI